jgi:hypothetical protein
VPALLSGWMPEKPWKEARWRNRLVLDDVELPELRIFLAVLVTAIRETGAQRPRAAARAVNVETPVAAAICRSVCPAASSPAIRAASAGVSLDAPFGQRRERHAVMQISPPGSPDP